MSKSYQRYIYQTDLNTRNIIQMLDELNFTVGMGYANYNHAKPRCNS